MIHVLNVNKNINYTGANAADSNAKEHDTPELNEYSHLKKRISKKE